MGSCYWRPCPPMARAHFKCLPSVRLYLLINWLVDLSPPQFPEFHYSPHTHHTCINIPQAPGRHSQPFPISLFPYTAPSPVRSTSPSPLFLCMQRSTRVRPVCLMYALTLPPKLWSLKGSFVTLESQVPHGEHLPNWDQIPYTRFLFDFW